MNKWIGIGRFTQEIEVKYTAGDNRAFLKNAIAIDRKQSKADRDAGKPKATDFVNIVAFDLNAENIGKYFSKGSKIVIEGRIQTGSYNDKDNKTVYTTDVIVENWEFAENTNKSATPNAPVGAPVSTDGFVNVANDVAEELPFL